MECAPQDRGVPREEGRVDQGGPVGGGVHEDIRERVESRRRSFEAINHPNYFPST